MANNVKTSLCNSSGVKEKSYKIKSDDYLHKAFPTIPSNSIIHKGRCGIGGTFMEITCLRHSIIVVPNTSIILNKKDQHKELFGVYGGVTEMDIIAYIESVISGQSQYLKIMSTPDSFVRLMGAFAKAGFDAMNNCFLLMDECHSAVTEVSYRPNIIKPYDYFFQFKDKALISATPYEFSDIRFKSLLRIKIEFSDSLDKKLDVVLCKNVHEALKILILDTKKNSGNIHVFYNSVKSIVDILDVLGVDGVSIFCADNKDNRITLGAYDKLIFNINSPYRPNKINFYTVKFFEGWDLRDSNATIAIVTDVNKEKTCIGITNKAVQAIGRLRNTAKNIYHITNVRGGNKQMDILTLKSRETDTACKAIKLYNDFKNSDSWTTKIKIALLSDMASTISKFSDIDIKGNNGDAIINHYKLDSIINEMISISQYEDKFSIKESWKSAGYKITMSHCVASMSTEDSKKIKKNRLSRNNRNKIIIDEIHTLKNEPKSLAFLDFNAQSLNEYRQNHTKLHNYYMVLGYDKIVDLNYNVPSMQKEYRLMANKNSITNKKFIDSIYTHFNCPAFWPSKTIKDNFYELRKVFSLDAVFTAADIKKYFEAREKVKWISNRPVKGYFLERKLCSIAG
jgi:hypothetical protein